MNLLTKIILYLTISISFSITDSYGDLKEETIWRAEVLGMSCPLCSNNIEKQLRRDRNVSKVVVDLGTGNVTVNYTNKDLNARESIKRAIENAGFTVKEVEPWNESP